MPIDVKQLELTQLTEQLAGVQHLLSVTQQVSNIDNIVTCSCTCLIFLVCVLQTAVIELSTSTLASIACVFCSFCSPAAMHALKPSSLH